jgi:hypothetical protein
LPFSRIPSAANGSSSWPPLGCRQMCSRRGMQQVAPLMQLAVSFATTLWLTGSPARAALVADAAVCDAQERGHQQSLWEILATFRRKIRSS